jgi:hypothetical protein
MGALHREIMVKSLRPVPPPGFIEDVTRLCDEYSAILAELPADAAIPNPAMVRQHLADAHNWRARARRKSGEVAAAAADFRRVAELFHAIGHEDAAERARDEMREMRVEEDGNVDEDVERLLSQLRGTTPGGLQHIRIQIELGELYSQNGDDYEARKHLLAAEAAMTAGYPNPSEATILTNLMQSLGAIEAGHGGTTAELPVMAAMDVRALYQRLYFALARAHRKSNPVRSAEYEEKFRDFNRGKRSLTPAQLEGLASGRLTLQDLDRQK